MKNSVVRELRGAERFRLKLPVNLSWQIRGEKRHQTEGVTRDISSRGMFVQARVSPPAGSSLRFEISLVVPDEASEAVRVEGRGRVLRVERSAPKSGIKGFAVVNIWFKVCEA